MAEKIILGKIVGVHGIRGLVKIKYFTETPEALTSYGPLTDKTGKTIFKVVPKGLNKGNILAEVNGITDRNQAELLIRQDLYVDGALLPETDEDEFYYRDLIGLTVKNPPGKLRGHIKDVCTFGAGDLRDIEFETGKAEFISFQREYVVSIDLDTKEIVIELPIMLEETAEERKSHEDRDD